MKTVCCEVCKLDKGIERPAVYDAPVGGGLWAAVCEFCFYRLSEDKKALATPL